jgi:hypothetical protein
MWLAYCEAHHDAKAEDIIASCDITKQTFEEYLSYSYSRNLATSDVIAEGRVKEGCHVQYLSFSFNGRI